MPDVGSSNATDGRHLTRSQRQLTEKESFSERESEEKGGKILMTGVDRRRVVGV